MKVKSITFSLCMWVFFLYESYNCAPTPTTTLSSARRWVSPCHPPGVGEQTDTSALTSDMTNQTLVRNVLTHISEIKTMVDNLADKFTKNTDTTSIRISPHFSSMTEERMENGEFFKEFPNITELRQRSQQYQSIDLLLHLIEDYKILSVITVYLEQAIKDEEDILGWTPHWREIERKVLIVLCNFHKFLTQEEREIIAHVSHEILYDCAEGMDCTSLRLQDEYHRDYMVLRTMSSIFENLVGIYNGFTISI